MKKIILAITGIMLILLFTGGNKRLSSSGEGATSDTLFSMDGKTDTIKVLREKGVTAMSYTMYTVDSSHITNVIVLRVVNGVVLATQTGDTLMSSDSSATAKLRVKAVPMAPLANEYWFRVAYAANHTGTNNSVDTNHVRHGVIRQYGYQ